MADNRLWFLMDDDGDTLELREVYGFDRPMLASFVANPGRCTAGVNIDVAGAIRLIERLREFVSKADSEVCRGNAR